MLVNQSDFYDERWAYGYRVPAIATAGFNVTGTGRRPGLGGSTPAGGRARRSWRRRATRDGDGQPRQVALDDVRAALRGGREAHAAEAGVAAGVHQDQPDQPDREQHVEDGDDLEHARQGSGSARPAASRIAPISSAAIRSFVT